MAIEHFLERVIVVPRNGYANRLQAWASAAILGAELDIPVQVLWEPEAIAPASASDLFAVQRVKASFVGADEVTEILGCAHADAPRYLTIDTDRRVVVLAGHDRGEQVFMAELLRALDHPCRPHTLVVIAGGKFHLPEASSFERQRKIFYDGLAWHPSIADRVEPELLQHQDFLGLHIRQTDRSREAPTTRALRSALTTLRDTSRTRTLFVAADTADAHERWASITRSLGLESWRVASVDLDRSRVGAGQDAMVDWLLLGHAQAIVYSQSSSFGQEAAVATGNADACIAVSATALRQRVRDGLGLGRAAVTYPSRHGWMSFTAARG